MENNEYLKKYYELGVEENRLIKDKAHTVEFITTTKYIEKYLKPEKKY